MSGSKRKSTHQSPIEAAQAPDSARLVVLPKNAENGVRPDAAKAKPKNERIGEILRNARLEQGHDLYAIAEYLRIKPAFLVALENSQYDEFPADAYVIGFLRSYAALLGIDPKDAVDRYRYEMAGRRKKPVLSMPLPMTEGRAPSALIMVGATIAALLIYALWYGISSSNRTEVTTPAALPTVQQNVPATGDTNSAAAGLTAPVTLSTPPASASANAAPVMPQAEPGILVAGNVPPALAPAAPEQVPAAKDTAKAETADSPPPVADSKDGKKQVYGDTGADSRITIRATQSSWVMITDADGKAVFDHVLKPGDSYKVPNKPGLFLTTGNGSGIVLSLNGADLPKIASGAPHVVRNIPLDPDRLNVEPSPQ